MCALGRIEWCVHCACVWGLGCENAYMYLCVCALMCLDADLMSMIIFSGPTYRSTREVTRCVLLLVGSGLFEDHRKNSLD